MYFSPYLCERAPDINSSRAEMHPAFSIYGCKPEILSLMQHLSNSCKVISPELLISKQYHNISTISKASSVELAVAAWKPTAAHLRGVTPVSHCKRKQGVSSAEAVRMQSRSSACPLPFHTGSVCSARLNSVFCTKWANSNLILNTIGLDLLLE